MPRPLPLKDSIAGAKDFANQLEAIAAAVISRMADNSKTADFSEPDRGKATSILEWATGELRAYSGPLFAALSAIDDIQVRELAADSLWHVLAAAHFIGTGRGAVDAGRVSALDEADAEMRALKQQAERARAARAQQIGPRLEARRAAVLAVWREQGCPNPRNSRAFAESLRDAVRKQLGRDEGVSAATIERDIAALLKSGDMKPPHT